MAHPHPPRQSLYPTSAGTSSSLHSSHSQPSQNPSSSSTTAATAALQRISARDLTESQIRLLNASQCLQFTDQLDQELLSLMQSLDGHFLRATRTVTDVLLPSIEKYGENSRDIWDAVKVRRILKGEDETNHILKDSNCKPTVFQNLLRSRRRHSIDGSYSQPRRGGRGRSRRQHRLSRRF